MKNFILLLAFILISTVHAGTCTSISRTNSASLSVLTSSKYNTDLNTAYTAVNSFDGGCVTSGTLESDALNTTQFAPLLKGLQQGCKLLYSNATTVQISRCIASVNGNFVNTTSNTNVSFGCSGCSSEVTNTLYYVYIKTGSSGTTLDPLISTSAPNEDGYDSSNNKVVGYFINNAASDIASTSIVQWHLNEFVDKPKLAGEAYIAGTANCSAWTRTNTAYGAFAADTDCPSPTIVGTPAMGTWLTTDADLPRFSVNSLKAGRYKAKFMSSARVAGGGLMSMAINDGTSTCVVQPQHSQASDYPFVVECFFTYASIGDRVFELYTASSTGAVTLVNNQTSPAAGIKFILEYWGE